MRAAKSISTVFLVALLVITGTVGACSPKQTAPPPAAAKTAVINIIIGPDAVGAGANYGGEFNPRIVEVSVGGTVTWNNTDKVHDKHDVISNDGLFNTTLRYGDSFNFTFTQNGTFNYHDDLYDNMDGMVIVK